MFMRNNLSNHSIIYAVLQNCSTLNCEDDHDDNGYETISSKSAWYKASACDINTFKSNIDPNFINKILLKPSLIHFKCTSYIESLFHAITTCTLGGGGEN